MKKLLTTILLIVTALSLFMLSACGGEETANTSVEESSSSSSTKPIRSFDDNNQSSSTGSSTDSNDSGEDSTSDDGDDDDIEIDGDTFLIDEIDTSTMSTNAQIVANYINDVKSISSKNFETKLEDIKYIKEQYAALTSQEQTEVSNYGKLLEAESAGLKFKAKYDVEKFKQEYENIANKTTFVQADRDVVLLLRTLVQSFSAEQRSQITNITAMEAKINSAYDELKSTGLLEWALVIDDCGGVVDGTISSGASFFTLTPNISSQGESGDENMKFNNKSMSNALFLKGEESNEPYVTFQATAKGILKLYAKGEQGKIVVSGASTATLANSEKYESDCFIASFSIESSGEYSLSIPGGELYIYAIVFSL